MINSTPFNQFSLNHTTQVIDKTMLEHIKKPALEAGLKTMRLFVKCRLKSFQTLINRK